MNIERVATADLIPYANNARTHSDAQVAQIAGSIRAFGFNNPVLIDEHSTIIAGHGRVMAAHKLALPDVPCVRLSHLNDAQKRAYILADNKIALNSGWDADLLRVEFERLSDEKFDVSLIGFDEKELAAMFNLNDDDGSDDESPVDEQRNLLLVECSGERELQTLFEEMKKRGFECKVMS
jgi:ParB-like chromosome segregation protein Spo0J